MALYRRVGGSLFDSVIRGPKSGRSGRLRSQILALEASKRDAPIQALLDLHEAGSVRSAWEGLGSIAYEIVRHFGPRHVVELGSFGGFSACALGLSLRDLGKGGILHAVDTWQGDGDTGRYGEDVYQNFLAVRGALGLESVIKPMRMTFEEASRAIEPGVDLLHIDGWHTFSAASHDFRMFKPLLAPGAIVMFHDMYGEFRGMRALWRLLSLKYPSYLVPYSHGLGILQVD